LATWPDILRFRLNFR